MHQLMEWVSSIASNLVESFGLWGIFFGMVLESACIPIPSEIIMLMGGFFAAKGVFSLWGVILAGIAGNMVGSILIYYIGKSGARALLDRYGKYVLIQPKHIAKAEAWFAKKGEWTALWGRVLPVMRTFISLPAGICKMNVITFCIYSLIGCTVWNILLAYLGFQLNQNWHVVEAYMRPVTYAVAALIVCYIVYLLMKMRNKQKTKVEGEV